MAKRIVWSQQAYFQRREILEYWFRRNGIKNYSRKLSLEFRETVQYKAKFNYLGRETDIPGVRVTVCGNYLLFYRLSDTLLEIISVFDSHRNPSTKITE